MCRGREVVEMRMRMRIVVISIIGVVMSYMIGQSYGELELGFYKGRCKSRELGVIGGAKDVDVEQVVRGLVQQAIKNGAIDAAALLRMQFHDCFVNGCDASLLLEVAGSEKQADANGSVRGYEFIDSVKTHLEGKCAGVVSCADIIVMATRDAFEFSSSPTMRYDVRTGRRDGLESKKENVKLPSPSFTVSQSIAAFDDKKLGVDDMVYLLGAHSVGDTHCSFVKSRLYNFNNTGKSDPQMDPQLVNQLKKRCPQSPASDGNSVKLDQGDTPNLVDNAFYGQIVKGRGVLQLDQDLNKDFRTNGTVERLSGDPVNFNTQFARAMVKLGEISYLTEPLGEIRSSCRARKSIF